MMARPALCMAFLALAAQAQWEPGLLGGLIGGMVEPYAMAHGEAHSHHVPTLDTLRLDRKALDTMSLRLGTRLTSAAEDEICYERSGWYGHAYSYCFQVEWLRAPSDTVLIDHNPWGDDTVALRKNRAYAQYAFDVRCDDSREVAANIAGFLQSAYHQVLIPGYAARNDLFRPPPHRSQGGLWARGLVSMGWAAQYTAGDNPFIGHKILLASLYYLCDAVAGLVAVGNATRAQDPQDLARRLAIVKAGHSVISAFLFTPWLSREVAETNRLVDSGFHFPAAVDELSGYP